MFNKSNINVDFYELLQVHPKADTEIIKKAYHTIIKQYHPDKGGSEEYTKLLNYAYEVLTDSNKRTEYDKQRALKIKYKLKGLIETTKESKVGLKTDKLLCPVLTSNSEVILADERGNRVIILNAQGNIVWQYGGGEYPNEILVKPKFACFSNGSLLIVDKDRVFEISFLKEVIWECPNKFLNSPTFAIPCSKDNLLIVNSDNIIEIDKNNSKIVWDYNGDEGFNLFKKNIDKKLFKPISAYMLDNKDILITDSGNNCILQVSRKKKIVWKYPDKRVNLSNENDLEFFNFNFVHWAQNSYLCVLNNKLLEISNNYDLLWKYELSNSDIKWAFKVDGNTVLVNYTHIVRKGLNQEIMLINKNGKTLWKYYYSQYRVL